MRVDTIDERLCLFREMTDHAGVDLDALAGLRADELRAAAQRCLGCRVGEECRAWLEDVDLAAPPPGFCRNVEVFGEWVESVLDPAPAPDRRAEAAAPPEAAD